MSSSLSTSSTSVSSQSSATSWISDKPSSFIQRIFFYILRWGTVPKHVAIIMDGNRRYAKQKCVEKVEGHQKGFSKLTETLQWCLDMNILEVTVYAFSIENFKRSQDEVDALMDLAKEKFRILIEEWAKLKEHGVCVRVVGNLTLLPKDLITLIMVTMLLTKDNKRAFLNIAFCYTGKEEMVNTSSLIAYGLRNDKIKTDDVNEMFFDQCLYTYQSSVPELVIRTSGELRISDFLPWQTSRSYIHFVNVLWPEFSAWTLMFAVFCYQHFAGKLAKPYRSPKVSSTDGSSEFADTLQTERVRTVVEMCGKNGTKLDYEKLKSASVEEIYDYYKTNLKT